MMRLRRCQPSESRATKDWVAENHYLQSAPPGYAFVLEFYDGTKMIGSHIWGRPQAKTYDADKVLQLYRVYFVDETAHCVESQGLSMARKYIRTWLPGIKLVLSYSDPSVGHQGTIYEADNWAPLGMTKEDHGYGFQRHKGRARTIQTVTPKMRWVRTP
jgi:hypothetical protein